MGTTGAVVSHGCARRHHADLSQRRHVPGDTPVDVIG
jgi:hypothetical protein